MIALFGYSLFFEYSDSEYLLSDVFFFCLQYAFNLFSHNAPILENGYNEEEMKLVKETRKIWVSGYIRATLCSFYCGLCSELWLCLRDPSHLSCSSQNDTEVKVTATCIRVPVMRAHAESVNLQFENPLDEVIIHIETVVLVALVFKVC